MSEVRVALLYSLLLGLPLSATGGDIQPTSGGPLLLRPSQGQSGRFHFAIMGEVVRPGVYEQTRQFPLISELIRKAGGPTDRAARSARIIRQGRALQQVFLSDDTKFRIYPDDVVVVGARYSSSRLTTFSTASQQFNDPSPESRPRSASADVQIALVNLIQQPVVLRVRGEYATVGAILTALGQKNLLKPNGAIPSSVRLIETGISRRFQQKPPTAGTRLASGSALVFDPRVIEAASIPHHTLPKPFIDTPESDTKPSSPQLSEVPHSQNDDQHAGTYNGDTRSHDTQADEVSGDLEAPALINRPTLSSGNRLNSRPAIRPEIQYGSASRLHTNSVAGHRPHSTRQRRSTWKIPKDTRFATATTITEQKKTGTNNSASDQLLTPRGYVTLLVGVVGVLAAGSAFLVLWSMARGVPMPKEHRAETIPMNEPQPANILNALIKNEFSIVEEPLEMPMSLELHGRPVGGRKTRVDSAHSLSAPHTGFDDFESDSALPNVVGKRRGLREEMNQRASDKKEGEIENAVASPSGPILDLDQYFDSDAGAESDPDIDLDSRLLMEADEQPSPRSEVHAEPSVYSIQPPTAEEKEEEEEDASPFLSMGVPTALAAAGPHLSLAGERREPISPATDDDEQNSDQRDSNPSVDAQTQNQSQDQSPGRYSHDLLDRVLSSVQRCMQRAVAS